MPRNKPAVVILHYGRPEVTRRLHEQLLRSDPDWREQIFVLDNHAPTPYPGAWRRLDANLYWAGALRYALATFAADGFSHLWFCNNDCYFVSKPPHLAKAWARLDKIEALLGPVGIYSPAAESNPYHPQIVARPDKQFREVEIIDGIAPLFDLEAVTASGGPDIEGNPYGYGVDIALSLAVRRLGRPLVVDHQCLARHIAHSAARAEDDFLRLAGIAEQAYLSRRLGPDYARIIADLKTVWRDHADFKPAAEASPTVSPAID